ncbi:HipA domain-containing protein [Aromatoleum diolicum]|uniref:HipA-like C-terminal domain-containing protein n=1 Tax=Aromatoleum diolicum TaxID=75796 RepID=A0ABX1Q5T0_9RHOO|nr:HipA domain-containing protein [Aromatoleum diolicum]NMG73719.1 hypothetical protein [Aromatoleum diolicum]
MKIAAKKQQKPFDVAGWESDEFEVFPQGARAKSAVKAPETPSEPVLRGGWRYLFKRSKSSYPDQYWGEVIAYRIGCLLGVPVPPAFAAYNSAMGTSAALIEWFYDEAQEGFVLAGDFLQQRKPDFDRDRGTDHNMRDNEVLLSALARSPKRFGVRFSEDWRQWWVDTLLFDALIGNTDRHQDNWGLIFNATSIRLAPAFDNGTSLGHERFISRVAGWRDEDIDRYISKGMHHVRWTVRDALPVREHLRLLDLALGKWPQTREIARRRLDFPKPMLRESIADLVMLAMPIPLTEGRLDFIVRLLSRRFELLQALLE